MRQILEGGACSLHLLASGPVVVFFSRWAARDGLRLFFEPWDLADFSKRHQSRTPIEVAREQGTFAPTSIEAAADTVPGWATSAVTFPNPVPGRARQGVASAEAMWCPGAIMGIAIGLMLMNTMKPTGTRCE
jgi:hypothetical protein